MDASQLTLCQLTKAEDRRRSDNDRAKKAHDDLIAAAYRAKADALEIEALAKRRLADEYDAARERGEVAKAGGERSGRERSTTKPTAADVSLSHFRKSAPASATSGLPRTTDIIRPARHVSNVPMGDIE